MELKGKYSAEYVIIKILSTFTLIHQFFPLKNKNDWGNYYCKQCHCVSHFNFKNSKTIYSDGSYRERNVGFHENLNEKEISPPIDLPWSTITFLRWEQAASKLKKYLNIQNKNKINFLDFGGYNGLTAYGIKNYFNIKNVTIADLDLKGLKTAQSYGFSILDLSNSNLPKNKYDLITSIQVLEHLERPSDTLLIVVIFFKGGRRYIY